MKLKTKKMKFNHFMENERFGLYYDCKKQNYKETQVVGLLSSVLSIKLGIGICQ